MAHLLLKGAEIGSQAKRTHGKVPAVGPSKAADCGAGWAKLQLASKAAAGGPGERPHNTEFQRQGNKASNL